MQKPDFRDCFIISSLVIGNSVTTIGDGAFNGCSSLSSLVIGNSVTTIGNNAFYDCYNLTSVAIPNSVTTIGNNAFYGCYNLTSVAIPNSVTTIGDRTFSYCESLISVELPNSVTTIGSEIFSGCPNLTSIYCAAVEPPSAIDAENTGLCFDDTYQNCKLYVPTGSKSDYESADSWKKFVNIFEYDFPLIYAESIALNKTAVSGYADETVQLRASISPWGVTTPSVIWSTDNAAVATVSESGLVTLVGEGTATITATAADKSGVSAACAVTVYGITGVESIPSAARVWGENGAIHISGTARETVKVYNVDGQLLYSGTDSRIPLNVRGICFVKLQGKVYKIMLK